MTEQREATTNLGQCIMGRNMERPCPFPATIELPRLREAAGICAYHAATEPLAHEQNELGLTLDKIEGYLEEAREDDNVLLVEALEHLQADFTRRMEVADKVLEDLNAAEWNLIR